MPMGGVMSDEPQTPQPAEGWYPDPNDSSRLRWWDGSAWTDHTHGGDEPQAAQPAAVPETPATPAAQTATPASTGGSGIVSNPAPGAGAAGSRPAPSGGSSAGEKGAVGEWLSVRSNQILLVILILAVALFVFVMVGGAA
jgi:hypothetical protein